MANVHIVIPEGMNRPDSDGLGLSPTFEACLQIVARDVAANSIVYMAPGNAFGHSVPEDIAAAARLRTLRPDLDVREVSVPRDRYLDTWDNAVFLREWAKQQGLWPLDECILYCYRYHAWRSRLCFRAAGYRIARIETAVPGQRYGRLPARIWYYDYPPAHAAYEALGLVHAGLRIASQGKAVAPAKAAKHRS